MKVLMVNKFYHVVGGSETYYFALKKELENEGHIVIDFSMKDEQNLPSPYEKYFVENADYAAKSGVKEKLRIAANIIYSTEAKKKFEALVKAEKPDLIHLHLFQHQISPSILDVIRKYRIPTVYTAHDLKMVCLNYKMMHHGHICEACRDGHLYHCACNCCVKESFSKSIINTMEGYLHKWHKSYDAIDRVITPSAFYKKKFEAFGVEADRLVHIPNFLDSAKPQVAVTEDSQQYYLYFGRLSEEKGIETLIKAVYKQKVRLCIIGSGPLADKLSKMIEKHKMTNVSLLGFKSGQELIDLVGNAKAVILPSEWYENGPYSAIEAIQMGRPIIGANIGGIPELIDGNGYLFESGNPADLRTKILQMEALDLASYHAMEEASQALFDRNYTWMAHYRRLLPVYEEVMKKKTPVYGRKKALILVNLAGFLTFLWNDIKTLQSMGYTVEVVMNAQMADGSDAVEVETLREMGIPFYHLDFESKNPFSGKNLTAFLTIRRILKQNYDLIHCHTPIVGFLTRLAANSYRRKGTKVIYTTHGFTFTDHASKKTWLLFYTMEKFASRFCDAIVTINHEDYENARRMHCKKVFVISSVGLDNERFKDVQVDRDAYRAQFGISPSDHMILAVGELSDRKNQKVIIRALAEMPDKENYVFVVFGRAVTDSPIPAALEQEAKEAGVRLILAGHRSDIPEANVCADVAVIPSVREGLGMAGLEALASGTPVVGSDVQGIREYVVNGETGYLCDPFDAADFAEKIRLLCSLPEEEKTVMAENCRAMAQKFDVHLSVPQVRAIYEEVTKEK